MTKSSGDLADYAGPHGEGWLDAVWRGVQRCCPRCGAPGMFCGYLGVSPACKRCGLDFEEIRSDDIPPYFTIVIVGHLMVPLLLVIEQMASPPTWLILSICLPLTLAFTLALLPFVKGAVMGILWNTKKPV